MNLGFSGGGRLAGFDPARRADDRPIEIRWPGANPSSVAGQMGHNRSGRGLLGRFPCRTRAARKEMGHGPKVTGRGPHRTVYVSVFSRSFIICFLFIVQFLGKFSTSFPIQNYPTKILFRKKKSKEKLLQSIKFMNF